MEKLRVLIVDDEPLARDSLRILLERDPEVEVAGECPDGQSAVEAIRAGAPDVVLLDVQMPGMGGFEVLAALDGVALPAIVFVTAYDRYALRAFDENAVDYLLKPYDDDRFELALERAKGRVRDRRVRDYSARLVELLAAVRGGGEREPAERLAVRSTGRVTLVRVDDVDWIGAAGSYAEVHARGATHLLRESLASLEARLDPKRFVRIHRSTIVNADRVRELRPFFHGEHVVLLDDGTELRLSRRHRAAVERLLGRA
jgi:two-component system LytT family response regulator